jgi:hypothetical protein
MPVTVSRILPPEEWKKRQLGNLEAVGESNYKQGISRPKKDPIAAGIAAEAKYAARIKKAVDEERRKKGLSKVTSDEWYQYSSAFSDKLVPGVKLRESKVAEFITGWVPKLESHVSKIDSLPAVTDADMEKRMLENRRGLMALKGTV